jgi:hypothetical protein
MANFDLCMPHTLIGLLGCLVLMAIGQGTILVVSIYVIVEFVTFIFTFVARDDLNFSITDVNLEKRSRFIPSYMFY